MSNDIELYLIRHAEAKMNTMSHLINGRSNDSPLTEFGRRQAIMLGDFLLDRGMLPTKIFTSPAVRTLMTSKITLNRMGLNENPTVSADLQELDQGDWVGKNRQETYSPEVIKKISKLGKNFKAPSGESMNEVGSRMFNWIDINVDSGNNDENINKIFVFTHGLAIRCLASYIDNWSHEKTFKTRTPNASISLFNVTNKLLSLNYIGLETSSI